MNQNVPSQPQPQPQPSPPLYTEQQMLEMASSGYDRATQVHLSDVIEALVGDAPVTHWANYLATHHPDPTDFLADLASHLAA